MAQASYTHTDVVGYSDEMLWGKEEDSNGKIKKRGIFPITRYDNILNRPRTITEDGSIANTPNADFHLVVTETEEVSDDVIFKLFGQTW